MANSVHTDSSGSTGLATGQTPIVLARLPRVGAVTPTSATVSAAPQPVPPPEVMPQLELRTEIEQRAHLHIANTPTDEQIPSPSHFADLEHAVDYESKIRQPATVRMPSPKPASQYESRRYDSTASTQARATEKPQGFSEKLFHLHAQLAPHAGLIVALALIASAGLLYWMIVGPAQVPTSHGYENTNGQFGFDLQDEEFRAASNSKTSPTEPPSEVDDQWTQVPLPVAPITQAKPETLQEPTSTDELFFPTSTQQPNALDFTKLPTPAGNALKPLPEVARRSAASTIR